MGRPKDLVSDLQKSLEIIKKMRVDIDRLKGNYVKEANRIARHYVFEWYCEYTPIYYRHRKKTLYHAFKITYEDHEIIEHFGPEDMYPLHRVDRIDPEYIYYNSFENGYHGGARSGIDPTGHPHPDPENHTPYYMKHNTKPPYQMWSYQAIQTSVPIERIKDALDERWKKTDNSIDRALTPRYNHFVRIMGKWQS